MLPYELLPRIGVVVVLSVGAGWIATKPANAQSWTSLSPAQMLSLVDGRGAYIPSVNYLIAVARNAGGGCDSPTQHVYGLAGANGLGGGVSWTTLSSADTGGPPRRAGHSALYNSLSDRLIVFCGGPGSTACGDPVRNDLWVL